ncbi:Protein adenylyltransferase FICD [Psilocybe cubensis]|uniref:Protein adenylyltransferase FICD n=2 Tax=Psilocybe cubensis TaxID=181762 RepID=A0ACB8H343_PSICU|nr:Protein adenylyltransferase FICD [Psilocybe cubensis]KAH9482122.1 Protein adenylyltransferase FICD [Psilocybe cubensis]
MADFPSSYEAISRLADLLSPYDVGTVPGFLRFLKWSNSVLIDNGALMFFTHLDLPNNDINISVSEANEYRVDAFCYNHGYVLVDRTDDNRPSSYIQRVSVFRHPTSTVSIIITVSASSLNFLPIFSAASTLHMNFISHEGAVCLYPDLLNNKSAVIQFAQRDDEPLISSYRSYGFNLRHQGSSRDHYCMKSPKSLTGNNVLFIPFSADGESAAPCHNAFGVTDVIWRLGGQCCDDHARIATVIDVPSKNIYKWLVRNHLATVGSSRDGSTWSQTTMESYASEALQEIPDLISQEDRERLIQTNELADTVSLYEELLEKYPERAHPYFLVRKANLVLRLGGDAIALGLYRKAQDILCRLSVCDEKLDVFLQAISERTERLANALLEKSCQVTYYRPWKPTKEYKFPTDQPQLPPGASELKERWNTLNQDPTFYASYLVKLAIETNHVESTFLLKEKSMQDLIRRGLDEGVISTEPHSPLSHPDKIRSILRDTVTAYQQLTPLVNNTAPLSMSAACAIHATLMKTSRFLESRYIAPGATRAETWKTVVISGSYNVQMCPYPEVDKEFEYICRMAKQWIRTWRNPFASASWTHLTLVSCHPFDDGNGRLVRIIASLPLLQHKFPPISITMAQRAEYYKGIVKARDGDHTDMLRCFVEGMKETLDLVESLRNS